MDNVKIMYLLMELIGQVLAWAVVAHDNMGYGHSFWSSLDIFRNFLLG